MQFRKVASILACGLMLFAAGCGNSDTKQATNTNTSAAYLTVEDMAGRKVILNAKPQRVVALAPSHLGLIEAVGGTIVGRATSKVGTIPESMKAVPEVGMVYSINMESLVGLKPDLVLASRNQHEKFIPLMESNKIPAIEIEIKTFDDVKKTLGLLGDVYGTQDKATAQIAALDKAIAEVTAKVPKEKKNIVIMHATASSVTVEGSKSIAGCVSDILGFRNVAAEALKGKSEKTPYSMEALISQNPDVIFVTSMGKEDEVENRLRKDFKDNAAWNSLNAVKNNQVFVLPENLFLINPGMKYPEAVKYMAGKVYPEAIK